MPRTLNKDKLLKMIKDPSPQVRMKIASLLFRAMEKNILTPRDHNGAAAMFAIAVDDPDMDVRRNLARLMCRSRHALPEIVATLACDEIEVAGPVLKHSPVLQEEDLVYLSRNGGRAVRMLIAGRDGLAGPICEALAESGEADVCRLLARNHSAALHPRDMARLLGRFRNNSRLSSEIMARPDVPATLKREVMREVSSSLHDFLLQKKWVSPQRAKSVVLGAMENGTLDISLTASEADLEHLAHRLAREGALTPTLIMRSACAGYLRFVETALSVMAHLPRKRVQSMLRGRGPFGIRAIFTKAGLPKQAFPLFHIAMETCQELIRESGGAGEDAGFHCRVIERVLTKYRDIAASDADQLLKMLEHFAADARRIERRQEDQRSIAA
ncbi:MAG: hypothetical protein C0605_04630 [Hyphomicrobiales bacterium]|nr:MAG: hypothetical protein C0605_04630 [Hyphomicrobiales bacterium]